MNEKSGKFRAFSRLAAGGCVGLVVDNIVKAALPESAGLLMKTATRLGGLVVSGVITKVAEDNFDEVVDLFKATMEEMMPDENEKYVVVDEEETDA